MRSKFFKIAIFLAAANAAAFGLIAHANTLGSNDMPWYSAFTGYGNLTNPPMIGGTYNFECISPVYASGGAVAVPTQVRTIFGSGEQYILTNFSGDFYQFTVGGSAMSSNSNDAMIVTDNSGYNIHCSGNTGDSIQMNSGGGGPSISLSLDEPRNGSTTPDFTYWVISESSAPSSSSYLKVLYGLSSSSLGYSDLASFSPFVSVSPTAVPKSQALWFPPLSVPATWFAEAELLDSSGAVLASSSLTKFFIDPNSATPTSTATSTGMAGYGSGGGSGAGGGVTWTPSSTDCVTVPSFWSDPAGNNVAQIENGICGAFLFLFIPSGNQQTDIGTRFNSLGSQVKTKPPFGYFTGAYGALQSFQDTGTSSIIDASSAAAMSPIFTPMDDGITVLLWLGFGFWIVRTFRKLNT